MARSGRPQAGRSGSLPPAANKVAVMNELGDGGGGVIGPGKTVKLFAALGRN